MAEEDQGKGKVGAGGVAGGPAGGQLAGIEGEQTNNQRNLSGGGIQPGPAVQAMTGQSNAPGGMGSTTGAENQIGSLDPNNSATGQRNTPTGEKKDTAKAKGSEDQPYVGDAPRHVDQTDKNAPTTLRASNAEAQSSQQARSDYSMGKPPREPGESDRAYDLRMEALEDAKRRADMSAEERMKEAGTHPDDLPEDATQEQRERAEKMLSYERIKDAVVSIQTEIDENLGAGVGVGRAQAALDTMLSELRTHIG